MGKFYFHKPERDYGFYLIPTIHMWRTDFKKQDPMAWISWGFVIKFLFWSTGITYNQK